MILILLFSIFTISFLISGLKFLRDSNKLSVSGPFPLPFVGNGHLFLGDTAQFFRQLEHLINEYGDIFRIYLLSTRYIVISSTKYIEPVISGTELITKGESYDYLHSWLGQGLLTSTGHKWKSHRKLLTPSFHFNILQTFLPIFIKNQKILNRKLSKLADGKSFDLFPVIALAALDNISEAAMGVSIHAQEDSESEYVRSVNVLGELIMKRIFNPLMSADFIFNLLPQKAKNDKALAFLHGQTNKVIRERQELLNKSNVTRPTYESELGIKKKSAFLDLLLLSEIDGKSLDMNSVREEVDTFMFEGHDTTSSAVCFILYCISNNEGVAKKILEEQNRIFGNDDRDPTFQDLQEMKYLEMVIKEGLRLYPSVPLIARRATKECNIAGVVVPKDTTIVMNIYHMQRDPRQFEDPLKFIPERFDAAYSNERNVYSWIAFSAGPRNCIGQKFAIMELKVTISSIVKQFDVLPSGKELVLSADLILRSQTGVHVKLIPK